MNIGDWVDILGTAFQTMGWVFLPVLFLPLIYIFFSHVQLLQNFSQAFIRTIDSVSYIIGEATKWLLPFLVLSIAFSVFALSIFGQSWTKLFERR